MVFLTDIEVAPGVMTTSITTSQSVKVNKYVHRVNNKAAVKNTRIKLFLTVDAQHLDAMKAKTTRSNSNEYR